MLRGTSWNDVLFGLALIAAGAGGIALAADLPFGNAVRMGPGYVPTLLGWLTIAFGVANMLRGAMVGGPALAAWSLRPLLAVSAAIGLFMAVDRIGLVAAVVGVTLVACLGERETRWAQAIVLAFIFFAVKIVAFVEYFGCFRQY